MRGARGTLACSRTAFLGSEPTSVVGLECGPIRSKIGVFTHVGPCGAASLPAACACQCLLYADSRPVLGEQWRPEQIICTRPPSYPT